MVKSEKYRRKSMKTTKKVLSLSVLGRRWIDEVNRRLRYFFPSTWLHSALERRQKEEERYRLQISCRRRSMQTTKVILISSVLRSKRTSD